MIFYKTDVLQSYAGIALCISILLGVVMKVNQKQLKKTNQTNPTVQVKISLT